MIDDGVMTLIVIFSIGLFFISIYALYRVCEYCWMYYQDYKMKSMLNTQTEQNQSKYPEYVDIPTVFTYVHNEVE